MKRSGLDKLWRAMKKWFSGLFKSKVDQTRPRRKTIHKS